MDLVNLIGNLISPQTLKNGFSEDIVSEVCLNLYSEHGVMVRTNFCFLPTWLQDIILLIDYDTELNMNGILGFLENSTGLMLDETIETLKRIDAIDDYITMKNIKEILTANGIEIKVLRENVNSGSQYEILNSLKVHDLHFEEILNEETNLYLYQDRDIFKLLFEYMDLYRSEIFKRDR